MGSQEQSDVSLERSSQGVGGDYLGPRSSPAKLDLILRLLETRVHSKQRIGMVEPVVLEVAPTMRY